MNIETKDLQLKLLSMLKQFHELCVNNDLIYFMAGGTMLGAVRHNGFIPWDDDVDVVMPREDYNNFKRIADRILPDNLEIKFYENTQNSPMHYMKLIDRNTTLIENKYRNYYEGVYIDVFPLDGAPSDLKMLIKKQKKVGKYISLIVNHCYTDGRHGLRKLYGFLARCFDLNKLHINLEKQITEYSYESSEIVGNFLGSYGINEFVPKKIFGTPVKYKFEDTELYGPEDYKSYLTNIYGDYMQLPPLEKRINSHQYFYLDLTQPYINYNKEKTEIYQ